MPKDLREERKEIFEETEAALQRGQTRRRKRYADAVPYIPVFQIMR